MELINIVGNVYGRLTVVSRAENGKDNRARFTCKCSCGGEITTSSNSLRRGYTTSCGCYRRDFRKTGFDPAVNDLFSVYKQGAEKKSREFSLTRKEFADIIMGSCIYCGAAPSRKHRPKRIKSDLLFNGIDRKDNSVGYVSGNVQPCCTICNQAKHTLTEEEFLSWLDRVFNFRKANNGT